MHWNQCPRSALQCTFVFVHCQSMFNHFAVMRIVKIESKVGGTHFRANDGCNAEFMNECDSQLVIDLVKNKTNVHCYSNLSKHCPEPRTLQRLSHCDQALD